MPSQRIPLFAALSTRDGTLTKDARLINCYGEKDPDSENEIWVVKRPGMTLYTNISAPAVGLGVFNWRGDLYSIFGNTFYKGSTAKGTVNTSGLYSFTSCLGATPKLFFKNHAAAYAYDDTNGLVQITDPNYPTVPLGGCAYLDGTIYVIDLNANIQGSGLNNPLTWDPLNKIVAQIESDRGIFIAKHKTFIIAMKEVTTEVFYDRGNPTGSPLAPIQGSKIALGCASELSVKQIGDDLIWVALSNDGGKQIVHMSELRSVVISDMAFKRILENLSFTTINSWGAQVDGHVLYGLTSTSSNETLVYDLSTHEWAQWTDPNGNFFPIACSTYDLTGKVVLQHLSDGNLYTLNPDVFQDNGVNFPVSIFTGQLDGGQRTKKQSAKGEIIGDRIPTSVSISWSDDDYQTYSSPSSIPMDQDRPFFQDGSSFSRRSWKLTHSDNTRLRLKALDLVLSPGSI